MPKGNRMSSLELSQYCGRAGSLNSASGRPAVMGSFAHAKFGKQPDEKAWRLKLTDEEVEEVEGWHSPAPLVIRGWGTFEYRNAEKEVTVALNSKGGYCEEGDPDCVTVGHIDSCWVNDRHAGIKIAVISDIKKSKYTVDGPTTLQNWSYGLAWASKHNCTHLVMDIWAATEGEHITSEVFDLFDCGDQLERVLHAAQNVDVDNPIMGVHCSSCYGWQRCDAYTVIASNVDGMADEEEIAPRNASMLLMQAEAHIRFGDLTKKRLKLYADRTPIISEDGFRSWGKTIMKGKESVPGVKKLRESLGEEEANKLITRGPDFPQYRFTNTEAGKDNAKKATAAKAKAKRLEAKKAKEAENG